MTKRPSITRTAKAKLPTEHGNFNIISYNLPSDDKAEHVALVMGSVSGFAAPILTRVHSRCLTGDVFGSKRCDCRDQLEISLKKISEQGQGVIVYLDQEGRGIGLRNKIKAYALQEQGLDTVSANEHLGFLPDERDYKVAALILADLGIGKINLITNNPEKIVSLQKYGIEVVNRLSAETEPTKENHNYLLTKKNRMNHILCLPE